MRQDQPRLGLRHSQNMIELVVVIQLPGVYKNRATNNWLPCRYNYSCSQSRAEARD